MRIAILRWGATNPTPACAVVIVTRQGSADASARAGAFGGDDDAPAVSGQIREVGGGAGEVPAVGVHVSGAHAHEGGRDDDGRRAVR